ncbi:Probable nicotinate-nucleotide pyrophosphorylase [carboxylating] [Porphyromonas crevioricanis]|uniref:Probable nicotinate-nucleotide pyrophosphorylase [carboxylating] n=1 Tax=Porphyromonas crevioricanis TaxID=393921 RepID=A0A2X4PNS5_9PORP|nr:carboxylating nicotinate-nucleotide diphosphorylase [Porphyromonas crevioricanis]GAD07222.1 quinolinate phosphoribosyltransferase [Porphyromonas crevioricanis JCM 13913]SQH73985.1 Probable nicotinate-nucleotide pyrophosphorylase [carboxylating] [Porphyromonas crevioricanis]
MQQNSSILQERLDDLIKLAFREDIFTGDVATEAIIPIQEEATAIISAKAEGIISGIEVAHRVLNYLGENEFTPLVNDGDRVHPGQELIRMKAKYNVLLSAERTMLNFMQRMSGIATATNQLVAAIEGTGTRLLDTRKTLPGHRYTDKMAVRHGGGLNHRMGLYDMAMLKDNHIKISGGITAAVRNARKQLPISILIEVETSTLEEVKEAVAVGADIIMLDNMSCEMMKQAVDIIGHKAKAEASGNITLERIAQVAATGVDYISVGAITHTVKALDISMNFVQNN